MSGTKLICVWDLVLPVCHELYMDLFCCFTEHFINFISLYFSKQSYEINSIVITFYTQGSWSLGRLSYIPIKGPSWDSCSFSKVLPISFSFLVMSFSFLSEKRLCYKSSYLFFTRLIWMGVFYSRDAKRKV